MRKLAHFREKSEAIQGQSDVSKIFFEDTRFFTNIESPEKFKLPKFDKYNGTGRPPTRLRLFGMKMTCYQKYDIDDPKLSRKPP